MLDTSLRQITGREDNAADGLVWQHPLRAALDLGGARVIDRAGARLAARHGPAWLPLGHVVAAFRTGYVLASRERSLDRVISRIAELTLHDRGFACEGAAMAVTLLDALVPWRKSRLSSLLACAPGQRYLVYVGVGWGHAFLRRTAAPTRVDRLDPVLRWLITDGIGFHDGFMRALPSARLPRRGARLSGYTLRTYDQGLGRSLWFTAATDPTAIGHAIDAASRERRADLWSGVGLACTYAGGLDRAGIAALASASGEWLPHVAQGVAFAAEAHMSASGCVPPHSELASQTICGISATASAQIARDTSEYLATATRTGEPAYEVWRARIRSAFGG